MWKQKKTCTSWLLFIPLLLSFNPSNFGSLWDQIQKRGDDRHIEEMIRARKYEIAEITKHWTEKLTKKKATRWDLEVQNLLEKGTLISAEGGCGGAYFLQDETKTPKFVIKPFDEELLCLNNRKKLASPYNRRTFRVRDCIPLYRAAQTEALSYSFASLLSLQYLTPETHLIIVKNAGFYDIQQAPPTEKLCAIQRYLPNLKNLDTVVKNWVREKTSEEEIEKIISQENFEEICLFIWLLHDTDAHCGNLYLNQKNQILKIDNGLAFPTKNSHLLNALYFFPHSKKKLSEKMKKKIQNLPIKKLAQEIRYYEMEDTLDAFYQRVDVLKKLTEKNYTLRDIDIRLHALQLPQGKTIALSPLSSSQIKEYLKEQ